MLLLSDCLAFEWHPQLSWGCHSKARQSDKSSTVSVYLWHQEEALEHVKLLSAAGANNKLSELKNRFYCFYCFLSVSSIITVTVSFSWLRASWYLVQRNKKCSADSLSKPHSQMVYLTNQFDRHPPITLCHAVTDDLSLIHIWRCRRIERCRSRWSPYH